MSRVKVAAAWVFFCPFVHALGIVAHVQGIKKFGCNFIETTSSLRHFPSGLFGARVQQDSPDSVRTLTGLTGLPLCRSRHRTVLCHCCSTSLSPRPAHLCHLFAYNNLSALRASLRPVLLTEYPVRYDASRVRIRMDGAVEPFAGSIALYSVYDIFACGSLAVHSSIRHTQRIYIGLLKTTDTRAGPDGLRRAVTHGHKVYSRTRSSA